MNKFQKLQLLLGEHDLSPCSTERAGIDRDILFRSNSVLVLCQ